MLNDPTVIILMYFILPLWLAAGFADWLCHRATHIETTTGAKESLNSSFDVRRDRAASPRGHVLGDQRFDYCCHVASLPRARGNRLMGRELCDHRSNGHANRTARA